MNFAASIRELLRFAYGVFQPPPKLRLSEWAEAYGVLSAESSAEPGKWHNIPYQVGIMDAITDPTVESVAVMKSARVGYTKVVGHAIGYHIHQDPCAIMVVQPTIEDAEGYSKEEIVPMIRDTPALAALVSDPKAKNSGNTILQKLFPGGLLSMVGANSPRGFRRVSRRVVIFDEVDGYPASAGSEGDPIKLGIKRTEYYWNRKIIAGSTPTTAGASKIEDLFEDSDQRYFNVPCPHCQHRHVLKFPNLKWPEGQPRKAYFECPSCLKPIEHKSKRWMIERGKWIATKPFSGKAGFHIWAAYSYSPNATWGHIAEEFLDANKKGNEELKTFVNTWLGETWKEKGESPEWKKLYDRREQYVIGTVPEGVVFLTAGVDVQDNRIEVEVVGWGPNKESWSIERLIFMGRTAEKAVWKNVEELLTKEYLRPETGELFYIRGMAVDTAGHNTQFVYGWCRKQPPARVFAIKGDPNLHQAVSTPKQTDINIQGKKIRRGVMLWKVGVNLLKGELYGWLKTEKPDDPNAPMPTGWCHFPEYDQEYFEQLTAEQLVPKKIKGKGKLGRSMLVWEKKRDRNEMLDCRVYSRAVAWILGLDRLADDEKKWKAALPKLRAAPKKALENKPASKPRRPSFWD